MNRARAPSRSFAWHALGWLSCALFLHGCASPTYGPGTPEGPADADAGRPGATVDASPADGRAGLDDASHTPEADAAADASAAPPAPTDGGESVPLPAWAEPLVGRFAFRVHSLSYDTLDIVSAGEELWLGEIVRDAAGLELRSETCQAIVTSSVLRIQMHEPSALGQQRRRVVLGDHEWSTDASAAYAGYTHALPDDCVGSPAQPIPRRTVQSWLPGSTCRCPASADAVPTLEDCRIGDPDGDGQPGMTLDLQGQLAGRPSGLDTRAHVVIDSRTHFVGGRIDAKGAHSATLVLDAQIRQLSCEPSGCGSIDNVQTTCDKQPPGVTLSPLRTSAPGGGAWDCAAVRAQAATLFPVPLPTTPRSCAQ